MFERKWRKLFLELNWGKEETKKTKEEELKTKLEEGGEIIKRDYEYLVKMKEMDLEIEREKREGKREKKKLELSVVVPVAGLVMARFHMLFCEVNTAIEHWKTMEGNIYIYIYIYV